MLVSRTVEPFRHAAPPALAAHRRAASGQHRLRHGFEHLVQCVGRLCADGAREPEEEELARFAPPPADPGASIGVTRLRRDPRQARFRILPPRFAADEAVLAYELPGVDGHTRYHECQEASQCGLHVLNMLAMALSGNDFGVLASRGALHRFIHERRGAVENGCYLDEDLRDFHNHAQACRPALALASAGVVAGGGLLFDELLEAPGDTSHAAGIDAVGLTFAFQNGEGAMVHTVLVRKVGPERFEMLDPLKPLARHIHAASMTRAIMGFIERLGAPDEGQAISVLYPSAAAPAAMAALTWF